MATGKCSAIRIPRSLFQMSTTNAHNSPNIARLVIGDLSHNAVCYSCSVPWIVLLQCSTERPAISQVRTNRPERHQPVFCFNTCPQRGLQIIHSSQMIPAAEASRASIHIQFPNLFGPRHLEGSICFQSIKYLAEPAVIGASARLIHQWLWEARSCCGGYDIIQKQVASSVVVSGQPRRLSILFISTPPGAGAPAPDNRHR